jgi:hypothetical protein
MGLLVPASLYVRKGAGTSFPTMAAAAEHAYASGLKAGPMERGCAMACIGGMVRAEPTFLRDFALQAWATRARDVVLRFDGRPTLAEVFGASRLLPALARAWTAQQGGLPQYVIVSEAWWGELVHGLASGLMGLPDLDSETDVRRMDLLEALAADVPLSITVPILETLADQVLDLLWARNVERRELAIRWLMMGQLLQAAGARLQGAEGVLEKLVSAAAATVGDESPRSLMNDAGYGTSMQCLGISFVEAVVRMCPFGDVHRCFERQLLRSLVGHADNPNSGDLLRCILRTLRRTFTLRRQYYDHDLRSFLGVTLGGSQWETELIEAVADMRVFARKVAPSSSGLGTVGSRGSHFNWFIVGQDAKSVVRALRSAIETLSLPADRIMPLQGKDVLACLLRWKVGRAPGEGEAEDGAMDDDDFIETLDDEFIETLDDELILDQGL